MKKLLMIMSLFAAVAFTTNSAKAQNAGDLLLGLINVDLSVVEAQIATGDITVTDVVDVQNVLNKNDIDILNNSINNNEIASDNQGFLNNLLRDADILNKNQVVVGVVLNALGGIEQIFVQNANQKPKKK